MPSSASHKSGVESDGRPVVRTPLIGAEGQTVFEMLDSGDKSPFGYESCLALVWLMVHLRAPGFIISRSRAAQPPVT